MIADKGVLANTEQNKHDFAFPFHCSFSSEWVTRNEQAIL